MIDADSQGEPTTVWRASRSLRGFAYAALVVLIVLMARVIVVYGYLATIGTLLVLGICGQLWWMVLRPKLRAGPDGVDVLAGRAPIHLEWRDIRGCEATPTGLHIICAGGRDVWSRVPQLPRGRTAQDGGTPTEAHRAAEYLAARAAWARKPHGQPPLYHSE